MNEYRAIYAEKPLSHAFKKRNTKPLLGGLVAATFILLTLWGCDNTFSIFGTISEEKKQIGENLFENTIVRTMADDTSNYYALLSQVVWRAKSGDTWDVLSVHDSTDYFASGLAGDGTNIYVAVSNRDNIFDDIYEGSYSSVSSSWTWDDGMGAKSDIKTAVGGDVFVDWLKCANNVLFVAVHYYSSSTLKYSLYYYNGSSFVKAGDAVSNLSNEPLIDIVYDGSSAYWLISDTKVYQGTTPGALTENSTPTSDHYLLGIATDGAGRIIVSARDGKLYDYNSGIWKAAISITSSKLGPVFFLTQPASDPRILVGKGVSTYGYMEYNLKKYDESGSGTLHQNGSSFQTTSSSIYYTTMPSKQVQGFWQPTGDSNTLFVLLASGDTDSYALYRNDFSSEEGWSGWTAE